MADSQIIEKLNILQRNVQEWDEAHVAYVMVEIRKLLDHNSNDQNRYLRFWCDWVVHTTKDNVRDAKEVISRLLAVTEVKLRNGMTEDQLVSQTPLIEDFKAEIFNFMRLKNMVVQDNMNWNSFLFSLCSILVEQPIIKPITQIGEICFFCVSTDKLKMTIKFTEPIKGCDHFDFYLNRYQVS